MQRIKIIKTITHIHNSLYWFSKLYIKLIIGQKYLKKQWYVQHPIPASLRDRPAKKPSTRSTVKRWETIGPRWRFCVRSALPRPVQPPPHFDRLFRTRFRKLSSGLLLNYSEKITGWRSIGPGPAFCPVRARSAVLGGASAVPPRATTRNAGRRRRRHKFARRPVAEKCKGPVIVCGSTVSRAERLRVSDTC